MVTRKRKVKKKKKQIGYTKIEQIVEKWLKELHISYQHDVSLGKYRVDFVVNKNIIVECYGSFWHCDPRYYEATYFNKALRMEAQGKWSKDANRQGVLQSMGYKFYALWESDIKRNPASVRSLIKSIIQ